jgi:hypothetical protein
MPLPEAHPARLPDVETRRLLAVTAYASVWLNLNFGGSKPLLC